MPCWFPLILPISLIVPSLNSWIRHPFWACHPFTSFLVPDWYRKPAPLWFGGQWSLQRKISFRLCCTSLEHSHISINRCWVVGHLGPWCLVPQFTLLQSVNHAWDPELPLALREKLAALAKGWCPCSRSGGYWPWPEVWVEGVEKSAIKSQSEAESAWKGYWAQTQVRKTGS